MSDTRLLLRMNPQAAIVAMVNAANNTDFRPDQFLIGPPTAGDGLTTTVTLTPRPAAAGDDEGLDGEPFEFTYERLDMASNLYGVMVGYAPPIPLSTQDVLVELGKRINSTFVLDDVILEEIGRHNGAPYRLRAKAESLRWVGELPLQITHLINLKSLLNASLPAGNPRLGTLTQPKSLWPLGVNVPYLNATPYRVVLEQYQEGDSIAEQSTLPALINAIIPAPSHRSQENLAVWVDQSTPTDFNLHNVTVGALADESGVNPINPLLNRSRTLTLDGGVLLNFLGGAVKLPYLLTDFSDSPFTDKPRLVQYGVVSYTDGSDYNTYLNQFQLGDVWLSLPMEQQPFEIEPGIAWVVDNTTPGPTNLYGAVVQYNGQKRVQDITPAHEGLDRSLVVTVSDYNTAYRGNITIFYRSPIQLSLTVPDGVIGGSYSQQFTPSGGTAPYTFAVVDGAMDPAQSVDPSTGVVTGDPSVAGNYTYTLLVTDATGVAVRFVMRYAVTAVPAKLQLTGTYKSGQVGKAYIDYLQIRGGLGPYFNARAVAGQIPSGMSLQVIGNTVRLSGTPTQDGSFNIVVGVDSTDGQTATVSMEVVIAPTLQIGGGAPVTGILNVAYSDLRPILNGVGPYSNARVLSGTLPAGLTVAVSDTNLRIYGTPTAAGSQTVTLAVDDSTQTTAQLVLTYVIYNPIALPGSITDVSVGVAFSQGLTATGGGGGYSYQTTALPPGITDSSDGTTLTLSGTPTTAGTYNVSVTVASQDGQTTTLSFDWVVNP